MNNFNALVTVAIDEAQKESERVVREAVPSGTFESQLNFYGHRLGEPKSDADKFIDDLVTSATGTDRIETTLPFTTVVFNFEPVQRGFIIKAMFK